MSTENTAAKAAKETKPDAKDAVSVAVDHDRVQMLSLKADGTPDQTAPEIIGDPEVAKKATAEQLTQQAVSAIDSATAPGGGTTVEDAPQDPVIAEAQAAHEKVADQAAKAAESVVDALHKG